MAEGGGRSGKLVVCKQACGVSVKHHTRTEVDEMVSVGWRVWRVWRGSVLCYTSTLYTVMCFVSVVEWYILPRVHISVL